MLRPCPCFTCQASVHAATGPVVAVQPDSVEERANVEVMEGSGWVIAGSLLQSLSKVGGLAASPAAQSSAHAVRCCSGSSTCPPAAVAEQGVCGAGLTLPVWGADPPGGQHHDSHLRHPAGARAGSLPPRHPRQDRQPGAPHAGKHCVRPCAPQHCFSQAAAICAHHSHNLSVLRSARA